MSNTEQQIEKEIQDNGLNAPRLTPDTLILLFKAFISLRLVMVMQVRSHLLKNLTHYLKVSDSSIHHSSLTY
jgi:hypothetical protein